MVTSLIVPSTNLSAYVNALRMTLCDRATGSELSDLYNLLFVLNLLSPTTETKTALVVDSD